MRRLLLSLLLALLLLFPAYADGLVHQLPEDGTAVHYDFEALIKEKDREKKRSGKFLFSSVGQVEINGEKHRWLEIKQTFRDDSDVFLIKVLAPEKQAKPGVALLEHITKAWFKAKGSEPSAVDVRKDPRGIALFFSGPLKNAKKLDKQKIASGLGPLDCEGVAGTLAGPSEGVVRLEAEVESRLHEKAPFGVVTFRVNFKAFRKGELQESGVLSMKLVEVSKNAKSELPELK